MGRRLRPGRLPAARRRSARADRRGVPVGGAGPGRCTVGGRRLAIAHLRRLPRRADAHAHGPEGRRLRGRRAGRPRRRGGEGPPISPGASATTARSTTDRRALCIASTRPRPRRSRLTRVPAPNGTRARDAWLAEVPPPAARRVARLEARRPGLWLLGVCDRAVAEGAEPGRGCGPLLHAVRGRCAWASPTPAGMRRPSPGRGGSSSGARISGRATAASSSRRPTRSATRPAGRRGSTPTAAPRRTACGRSSGAGWRSTIRGWSRLATGWRETSPSARIRARSIRSAKPNAMRPIITTPGRWPTRGGRSGATRASG